MRHAVLSSALLAACVGNDGGETGDSGTGVGKLALTFRIDSDYQAAMDEPAVGTFYGAFWRARRTSRGARSSRNTRRRSRA